MKIASLITCHNRREKTLKCLSNLYSAVIPTGVSLKVYLVDYGSTDGTREAIKENFPQVKIIKGNGSLYWNQGMRLAWKTAAEEYDYDFYLWLNDDTIIDKNSLKELLVSYQEAYKLEGKPAIIVGACRQSEKNDEFSYGGRNENGPVIPNGELQTCKYINGNVVLIPREIYKSLGNLSNDYTHTMGDFDYGLRALQYGYRCYTTKTYIGTCPNNNETQLCFDSNVPISIRLKSLKSPKGLNIKEYNIFRKKYWGWKWIIYAVKAYAKTISPKYYNLIFK